MAVILIMDDYPGMRDMLEETLVADGHTVFAATNGKEGLELWSAHSPDLVIIDIFMPVKEGLETIQELRRKRPDVKIIAISGAPTGVLVLNMAKSWARRKCSTNHFFPMKLVLLWLNCWWRFSG
jgi:two-component system nitrogen regulation response regulator NtrX